MRRASFVSLPLVFVLLLRMQTLLAVRKSHKPNRWAAEIDWKQADACLSVPG